MYYYDIITIYLYRRQRRELPSNLELQLQSEHNERSLPGLDEKASIQPNDYYTIENCIPNLMMDRMVLLRRVILRRQVCKTEKKYLLLNCFVM